MPPPLNLPGYYFDQVKNRYFPLSSKPKTPSPQTESDRLLRPFPSQSRQQQRTSRDVVWNTSQKLRTTDSHSQREHAIHAIQCSQIASTSRCEKTDIPMYGSITSFCATKIHDQIRNFIGDSRGWLYSSTSMDGDAATQHWTTELNLEVSSPISSICASGSRCVASTFSAECKIFVRDLNAFGTTYILKMPQNIRDVRSTHLRDRELVLGAATQAVYLQDVETAVSPRCLVTQSDVFAVHQQKNLVYAGTRNGSIHRFDLRADKPHGQKLFEGRFKKQRSSVLHLNIVHDWQLLTSHMNGDLATFDLRFPRESSPIMKFLGHVNSNTERLGIAVDPSENFIFAAGQDCRIRAWSLRTGRQLSCPSPFPSPSLSQPLQSTLSSSAMDIDSAIPPLGDQNNPLRAVFGKYIQTMQVADEKGGMVLWAASDTHLFKYYLGQRIWV